MNIQDLSGQALGQYELRELLGLGGMSAVYRAYQLNLKREVAVKVLPPALAREPNYVQRFSREAETAAALEHPHIVPIYDYGVEERTSYIVMRLLTGGSLADRMMQNAGLPSPDEVVRVLAQIAEAFDYAHSKGVIHRDVKPSNIMFDAHGNAFLVDFGIAKMLKSTTSSLTATGAVLGTPLYMAPEQWRSERPTAATDQYALGVTLFQWLTGTMPFEADTPYSLMHMHLNQPPPPLAEWRPELPDAVGTVLQRALAKAPEDRFPSMQAFARAFENAVYAAQQEATTPLSPVFSSVIETSPNVAGAGDEADEEDIAQSAVLPVTVARPPQRSRVVWWSAGVGVLALLGVLAVFLLLWGRGRASSPTLAPSGAAMMASHTALMPTRPLFGASAMTVSPVVPTTAAVIAILPSPTATFSLTPTAGPTTTHTATLRPTTLPPTPSFTATSTPSQTYTPTATPNEAATVEALVNVAMTRTALSWTSTPTASATWTPSATFTETAIPSATRTPTATPSATFTPTITRSPTPTFSLTPTVSPSSSYTPTPQATATIFGGGAGQIAFVSERDGNREIYVMRYTGEVLYRLTNDPADDWDPAWSPDGQRLAFYSDRDGDAEIYVMNADGTGLRNLTNHPANDYHPAWSPDGQRLTFYSDRSGNGEVYVVNADGTGLRNLTNHPANDGGATWSADGRRIAFNSERDGNAEVYVMNADGSSPLRLTYNEAEDGWPAWSPDGSRIAFQSNRNGAWDIYVIEANGTHLQRVTTSAANDWWPTWSADGQWLLFTSDREGVAGIYIVPADGGDARRLSDLMSWNDSPAWRPLE